MSEKQKQIRKTLDKVLPRLSEEDQSYLLGFGEGVIAGMKAGKTGDANSSMPEEKKADFA